MDLSMVETHETLSPSQSRSYFNALENHGQLNHESFNNSRNLFFNCCSFSYKLAFCAYRIPVRNCILIRNNLIRNFNKKIFLICTILIDHFLHF